MAKAQKDAPEVYTLTCGEMSVKVTNFGATLMSCKVPDKKGNLADVVHGFDSPMEYAEKKDPFFGATVGRYANRIAKGRFSLNGKTYTLPCNNGPNHLHGGTEKGNFSQQVWHVDRKGSSEIRMQLKSPDQTEGYPGTLLASATYRLFKQGEAYGLEMLLQGRLQADAKGDTILNMCNHAYWNLEGHGAKSIKDHVLILPNTTRYTPVNGELIPTGDITLIKGTELDLTQPERPLGHFLSLSTTTPPGLDHNFILDREKSDESTAALPGNLLLAAVLCDPKSGRCMEVWTTQPAIQVYTSNFLDGSLKGKEGVAYEQHTAVCLETHNFPDSPNHPNFPSPVLSLGQMYSHRTIHLFTATSDNHHGPSAATPKIKSKL